MEHSSRPHLHTCLCHNTITSSTALCNILLTND
uniref:Uncharacterized protein n=1 Tax=Anguilla anguilla TaxID=7936 RepID=A0A0E9W6P2_ANGAN